MTDTKFQVGDRVSAFGLEGVVSSIEDESFYPLKVDFYNCRYSDSFAHDGRLLHWHKTPSLMLIEKAKPEMKYVEKVMYAPVLLDPLCDSVSDFIFPSISKLFEQRPNCKGYMELKVWIKNEEP